MILIITLLIATHHPGAGLLLLSGYLLVKSFL
jgi:ABC-type transport system involved in cytochrome bd biosynthesis fused ATPase/permease subunit